jgi:hypothetical protein
VMRRAPWGGARGARGVPHVSAVARDNLGHRLPSRNAVWCKPRNIRASQALLCGLFTSPATSNCVWRPARKLAR